MSGVTEIDPGLLARFRSAGSAISWRSARQGRRPPRGTTARIAHLNDEECRVEARGTGVKGAVTAESGPLGALVLLLEIDRRGPPRGLGAANAGRDPAFPGGALVASWSAARVPQDTSPRIADLVELARYALA